MALRRVLVVFAVTISVVTATGCASRGELHFDASTVNAEWPKPPDPPRYRFVGQLTGEGNFHYKQDGRAIARRFLHWVVGFAFGRRPDVLKRPQSGYVDDAAGRIYVTDAGRKGVFVFDQKNGRLRVWEAASKHRDFVTPIAITKGPRDELLVSDADLGVVVRLNQAGEPLGWIGEGVLSRPTGVAFDPLGERIYVADTSAHDIKVFTADGELKDTFGRKGGGDGEFNAPTHVTFARQKLFVVDTLNSRVQVFSPSGELLRGFGRRGMYVGNLPRPKGVAVDKEGHVYVVESYYDYLLVYDDQGRPLLPIGGTGAGIGQFYLPSGVWTDSSDRVFVADMFNGRVAVFQYLGDPSGPPKNAAVD